MNNLTSHPIRHTSGSETEWHQHDTAQMYWINQGTATIETLDHQWTMTPASIGWIPACLEHKSNVVSDMEAFIIYLPVNDVYSPTSQAKVIASNALIAALIERIKGFDFTHLTLSQQRLIDVLIDEVNAAKPCNLYLPLPNKNNIRRLTYWLMSHPDDPRSQSQLAADFATSSRTLSRVFKSETGINFGFWRQQARLISSLTMLSQGMSVTSTALSCGYSNTSSYITAFKARFGITPSKYFN
ncbi:AraC family transcriptional regulator [Vibrio pectenicida]|uniref:AraC family transcriptional regulator n=1 Tax=Vibrio pectenicida TaxID=62763 RepID=A0A3R9F8T3_9VIBR|nr:AraC family transcriptional regulator [Vibrio pectenicida]RSD31478.1 AraC family transcriptional regulator [Vibrio pectenicida]